MFLTGNESKGDGVDLDLLKNFCAVAKFCNMTKAAEYRGISPSAVSKKIAALEKEMGGVILMQRFPSKLYLTEEGKLFLSVAERILMEIETSKALMQGPAESESGSLRVLAMASLGVFWLSDRMKELSMRYPELELDMVFDDLKSLAVASHNSGVYVGLATIEPRGDSSYIWKRLGSFYAYPYAHQSYIHEHGMPKTFSDLSQHKIIRSECLPEPSSVTENRQLHCLEYLGMPPGKRREASLTIDNLMAKRSLIETGFGIGMLASYMAEKRPLVRLFDGVYDPAVHNRPCNVYLVYPSHLKHFRRIAIFKNFVLEKLGESDHFFDLAAQ